MKLDIKRGNRDEQLNCLSVLGEKSTVAKATKFRRVSLYFLSVILFAPVERALNGC